MQSGTKCGARTRSGGTCNAYVVTGATRCRMHGASSPRAKAKAEQRILEARVRGVLDAEGVRDIRNPFEALRDLAAEIAGAKDGLRSHVDRLESLTSVDGFGTVSVAAELKLYGDYLDKTVKVLDVLARLDVSERILQWQQDDARLGEYILRGALTDLGLDWEDRNVVDTVRRWLIRASEGVPNGQLPAN